MSVEGLAFMLSLHMVPQKEVIQKSNSHCGHLKCFSDKNNGNSRIGSCSSEYEEHTEKSILVHRPSS